MRYFATLALMVLMLAGCSGRPLPSVNAPDSVGDFVQRYQLEPGNRVRVVVFNEQNLSSEYLIDTAGNINMPLAGTVHAAGGTAAALTEKIQDALIRSNYLRDPKVTVEVQTYRPFYVLGEVKQPGEYTFTVGMSVLSAIARAGGYDYRAREEEVILLRIVDGREQEFRAIERTPILPGDIIRVTERHF